MAAHKAALPPPTTSTSTESGGADKSGDADMAARALLFLIVPENHD
jgi:hypothetical protein